MGEEIKLFESDLFGSLRVIADEQIGNTLLCAKDVASALGYKNTKDAVAKHCKWVAIRYPLQTTGGLQQVRQKATEMGLFRIKETAITHSDGHVTVNRTPKVTGKGQRFFVEKYGSK